MSLRAGLLLTSPPDRLMYIMDPTPSKSFRISVAGKRVNKYSDKLVHPEEDPSGFRQRILDLLGSDAVKHRTWRDSVDAALGRVRRRPSLLPELVSLPPFRAMEFCNDPLAAFSGHLREHKIVLRALTSCSRLDDFGATYTFGFYTNLFRGPGIPFWLSDDFDWFLFLVPNAASTDDGKVLQRIGLVPKQLLWDLDAATGRTAAAKIHSDLFFERGVWKAGKFRFGAWKAGELEGTVLPGLEDYFIDVDVPPDELGAFVERHLSLDKTDS